MAVDLARLRALYDHRQAYTTDWQAFPNGNHATWVDEWLSACPSVLNELESLRAERTAERCAVTRAIAEERAAIVAWMRVNGTGHLADCIQRGDHHNIGQPTTAPTTIPKCHRCAERDRVTPAEARQA